MIRPGSSPSWDSPRAELVRARHGRHDIVVDGTRVGSLYVTTDSSMAMLHWIGIDAAYRDRHFGGAAVRALHRELVAAKIQRLAVMTPTSKRVMRLFTHVFGRPHKCDWNGTVSCGEVYVELPDEPPAWVEAAYAQAVEIPEWFPVTTVWYKVKP